MRKENSTGGRGVLDQFAGMYLKARWYVGAGLVTIKTVFLLFDLGSPFSWVLGVAGFVVLGHAIAMHALGADTVLFALIVDVTATHAAVLVVAASVENGLPPALIVVTATTVVVGLFSDGWRRNALIGYLTALALVALIVVEDGNVAGAADNIIVVVFVVGLVTGVISAVRQGLIELEAARAQTLGVVSHELRNHLTGVIGATELMMDQEVELGSGDVAELIELSHDQAVEAGEVIEDLLVASRAERGVLDAVPEVVDLRPITEAVIRRSSVDSSDISIESRDEQVWAMADPLRYRQIVRNLLTNALRYGGTTIRVSLESSGDRVSVTVADDGDGIKPAEVSSLFQPYHRSAKSAPGSTGLGLWIARSLAHKMGGSLTYRRHDGLTLFELTLPAAQIPATSTHHSTPETPSELTSNSS